MAEQTPKPSSDKKCSARLCESAAVARYVQMCEHEHRVEGFMCGSTHRLLPIPSSARCRECGHVCRLSQKAFPLSEVSSV